jgi:hypothetical protein
VSDVRLALPRVEVTLDDGSTLQAQVINSDMVRWDRTAAKHGWPTVQTAPFLWLTFVAWSALRREGAIGEDVGWDAFVDRRCVQVRNLTDVEGTEDDDGVVPFPEDRALG